MKVKNSYLKLMLWTLVGAAIGAVLGVGTVLLAKEGDSSAIELLYDAVVRSTVWIQLTVWLVIGGISLFLMNKAKKLAPLAEADDGWEAEKKAGGAQNTVLTMTNVNFVVQIMVFGIGMDQKNPYALWSVALFLVSTISMACMEIAVIKQVKKMNPMKQGDPGDLTFARAWENSCDEAEKLQIYRCGYKAFQVTRYTLMLGLLAAIVGKLNMGTGNMPILLLGVVMLVQSISYGIYSMKDGKALRE